MRTDETGFARTELYVVLIVEDDTVRLVIEYSTALFAPATIRAWPGNSRRRSRVRLMFMEVTVRATGTLDQRYGAVASIGKEAS